MRQLLSATPVRLALPGLVLLVLLGLAVGDLAQRQWIYADNAYAPWLLAVTVLLLVHRGRRVDWSASCPAGTLLGSVLLMLGGSAYAVGHSQKVELITVSGCILLMAGAIAWTGGLQALRQLRFPLVFWSLSLPYPGWLVDRLTSPMKLWVSQGTEAVLYALGYPVARSGVVLAIGPYQLLVADACSGLNSLIFLVALGLLYLHLTGPRPAWHRVVMGLALLPLALLANGVRVFILMLLTYYFGDAVGQSYWHDLAGVMLFATGFLSLLALDALLGWIGPRHHLAPVISLPAVPAAHPGRGLSWRRSAGLAVVLLLTAGLARFLTPDRLQAQLDPMPPLSQLVPETLGHWRHDARADILLVEPNTQASVQRLYSQTLARTYINPAGERIMLSIAYGGRQMGDELQAHRPEYCYQAQGFELLDSRDVPLALGGQLLNVRRLVAVRHERVEPITYWMTIGKRPALPGWRRKWAQMRSGLSGEVPDGTLIRVSSLSTRTDQAFALQADFVAAMEEAGLDRLGLARRSD
ncbi:EpsI family protein [Thauera aromatica]|uniref:exosortase-associated protein EpsI, B-type n=1 Tax=Thauera aromatica TaxID=59405 RepID=UPI001FFC9051|nr:exosortase-associated protein EpsI, B-type [Thauera aromatica]MCK2086855.1 EpsI family protein [Thauera aromatica]